MGSNAADGLKQSWETLTIYNGDSIIYPDLFLILGNHIIDLSGCRALTTPWGSLALSGGGWRSGADRRRRDSGGSRALREAPPYGT
jgi:hypothetical protein